MFKIVDRPRAWWPVKFNGVAEDGSIITNRIELRFVIFDEDENLALQAELTKIALGPDAAAGASVGTLGADILEKIAEDWKDVGVDDGTGEGKSLPFIRANMERLCRVPNVLQAICTAYAACRAGETGVRAGN